MKNVRFNRLFSLVLCITMMISLCGCRSTQENDNGESDQQKTESKSGKKTIDGVSFEKAEYEKFNSYAKDNGLHGKLIYIDGVVGDLRSASTDQSKPYSDYLALSIIQDDGSEWLLELKPEPETNREKIESMAERKVSLYCVYEGLSTDYKKPVVSFYSSLISCHIFDKEDKVRIYWEDCKSDVKAMVAWFDKNATETYVDDLIYHNKQGRYCKTSGVIDRVSSDEGYFSVFTDGGSGILRQYRFNISTPLLPEHPVDLTGLRFGDSVTVYYQIGSDNLPCVLSVKKVGDVGITEEDIFKLIAKEYKVYSYKDIARNPEKVKGSKAMVSGKVIQVIEQGNDVNLRVNITSSDWGIYTDTVYVTYTKKSPDEDRILEDDIITIYGTLDGLYTYDAVSGAQVTLPLIQSDYIRILE